MQRNDKFHGIHGQPMVNKRAEESGQQAVERLAKRSALEIDTSSNEQLGKENTCCEEAHALCTAVCHRKYTNGNCKC